MVQIPKAFIMVFHLAAAADNKSQLRIQNAITRAARQGGFFENVDAISRDLSITDQKSGGGEAGKAGTNQPRRLFIGVLRLAGTGKGFIVSIGIVHIIVPPD